MIRKAEFIDIAAMAAIHYDAELASAKNTAREEIVRATPRENKIIAWEKTFADASVSILVAEDSSNLMGFISYGPFRDSKPSTEKSGEIHTIFVRQTYWGQGIGRSLCNEALSAFASQGAKEVRLWVYEDNSIARAFYEKMGFSLTNIFKMAKTGKAVLYAKRQQ